MSGTWHCKTGRSTLVCPLIAQGEACMELRSSICKVMSRLSLHAKTYAELFGLLISNASAAVAEADSIKSSESIHNSPASLESTTPA